MLLATSAMVVREAPSAEMIAAVETAAAATKAAAAPAAPAPPSPNQFDGLIHGKNGALTFPGGQAVGGIANENYAGSYNGPVIAGNTAENGSAMTHVDIVQSQGNGHVGGVWPYRSDTTGVSAARVSVIRAAH